MVARGGSGRAAPVVGSYAGTLLARTEEQERRSRVQRTQCPWSDDSLYQLPAAATDSSTSDCAYHVPQYYNSTMPRNTDPSSPVYQSPYTTGTWRAYSKTLERSAPHAPHSAGYSFPPCTSAFSLPVYGVKTERYSRPTGAVLLPAPATAPATPDIHVIGACGGHCPGFEYVCYYILQIIFVVGILTGISLCIAGVVLRRSNRGGDLGVLVYIGCLSSSVCAVLLGVQCCVRREIRHRKKRANTHIPMQTILEAPAQAFPLLQTTLPHQVYGPTTICSEDESTGVPWWRRNETD